MDSPILIIIVIIVVLIVIIGGIYGFISSSNKKSKSIALLKQKSKTLYSSNILTSYDGHTAFGIDEARKKLVFKNQSNEIFEYDYQDLNDSELLIDGKTIKASNTKTAIGAALGYSIAGASGFILGAIAATSKDKIKVKSINIKLVFKNASVNHIINLYDGGFMSLESDKEPVKSSMLTTRKWVEKIENILKQK